MLLLVMADETVLRGGVAHLRDRCGLSATAVGNISVALQLLELNPVDAIVTEQQPDSTPWLRSLARRFPHVRIVSVPAGADWDEVAEEIRDGVDSPHTGQCVVAYGIEEFLGLLAMTNRDADLEVTAGHRVGHLWVREGHLVHAELEAVAGEEAAYRIASWVSARVKSHAPGRDEPPLTLHLPVTAVLHEAARRADELARLGSRPDVSGVLARLRGTHRKGAAALVDVDNRVLVAEAGTLRGSPLRQLWTMLSPAPGRAPEAAGQPAGATCWWEDATLAVASMGSRHALAALSHDPPGMTAVRRAVVEGAREIDDIIETIYDGSTAAMAEGLPW